MTVALAAAFAGGIRAERARAGLTQAQLAERLAWSATKVASVERGERALLAADLADVCRALGVPLGQLLAAADPADRAALGI